MDTNPISGPPASRRWLSVVALGGIFLAALGLGGWAVWRPGPGESPAKPPDPRRTYATPFRNVRPDVPYVGDAVCAACHPDIAETYQQHSMGRSLAPVAAVADRQHYGRDVHNPFEALGSYFLVERRGGQVFHHETRRDAQGQAVADCEAEIHYVIGSGSHAHSYLLERDGFVFQSPITWYSQKGRWDLSPGFEGLHDRFERQVQAECLFCHSNRVEPIEHTRNRYEAPLFRGHSIGCERCHGPGELHQRRWEAGEVFAGPDDTIVNPRHLPADLREDVCQQCHLEGQQRVVRRGLGLFDYRPGLPLHLFWSIYVVSPHAGTPNSVVSHVEQMHASRCFQASAGKLGCVSCHDPHALPAAAEKVAFYRGRCQSCHAEKPCGLPPAERLARSKEDDCTACHMPRSASSDVAHVAITDHRVPRRPGDSPRGQGTLASLAPGEIPLVHFHRERLDPEDKGAARDRGLALAGLARRYRQAGGPPGRAALPLLEAAVQASPEDLPAWEALAYVRAGQGRQREALAAALAALALDPRRETALEDAATIAEALERRDAALGYWRRVVEANPWSSRYRFHLARMLAEGRQWREAEEQCRQVLRHNPANVEVRLLLVAGALQNGEKERARAEFQKVLDVNPPDPDRLRRWFAAKLREAGW